MSMRPLNVRAGAARFWQLSEAMWKTYARREPFKLLLEFRYILDVGLKLFNGVHGMQVLSPEINLLGHV